ncbi:hypothetical protein [Aureivirga sp. CE67]|uniref:hypothetical protein n=1 Tax=Aureivirga sp. CE67 TaxID=1788983 RepID=UPI0018C8E8FA|nr:hypothetical protein [Aureivirga sp. CE67]
MFQRYNTIGPIILLPKKYACEKWSGLYALKSDFENLDFNQVVSRFEEKGKMVVSFNYLNREFLAFDIFDHQEVDFSLIEMDEIIYILRYCMESDKEIIQSEKLRNIESWELDFEIEFSTEEYLLFDAGINFFELELDEFPTLFLEQGKYKIETKILNEDLSEYVIHKIERIL